MPKAQNHASMAVALLTLFALSGFSGLIYQSIWTQYLGLFLGHAAHAQSFVLMLFMGGMALGAWYASRRSEHLAHPLVAYALAELLIGVLGFAFDPIYRGVTGLAYNQLFPMVGAGAALDVTRYVVAILLIGPQCILLGMTFPLMSAGYLRLAPGSGGKVLAGLYFTNSLGAAAGAIASTFLLLPVIGLPGTVMTGGLLSIVVAILIWPLAKGTTPALAPSQEATQARIGSRLIYAAAAITGATSFVYEVTWVRMLTQAVGSTLHAFEIMLAAFIAGLAFGGLWLRRRADALARPLAAAGWAQVLMGIAALGSLFVYAHAFDWVAGLRAGLVKSDVGYAFYNVATSLISLAVMFPAAFFAGMTLPLLTLVLLRRGAGEAAIGRTYAANTLGAIVGVLLTVHFLMPMLGVRIGLWVAAIGDLLLGLLLLVRGLDTAGSRRQALVFASATSLVVSIAALAWTSIDPKVLASSVYRGGHASLQQDAEMLFYGDGKTATVAMYRLPGEFELRSIATNGKVDAALRNDIKQVPTLDEYTMVLAGALPLAVHLAPKNVAVIGFGSGLTAHTLLGSDLVESVDIIEIEPFMVDAARNFGARVERAYSDPRSHIIIDDAKAYLSGSPKRYQVIVSEPSNPWVSGVAALFTDEFYDFVPRHLSDDGVFVQWLQLYEINPDLVASVLKAMLPHFADVQAYVANRSDLLLIASREGAIPPLRDIVAHSPTMRNELERLSMGSKTDMQRYYLMDRVGLAAVAKTTGAPSNSDFFPYVQLNAPAARFAESTATDIAKLMSAPWPLLEAVAGYTPSSLEEREHNQPIAVFHDVAIRAASGIRASLLGLEMPGVEGPWDEFAVPLQLTTSVSQQCTGSAVNEWLNASSTIAAGTIPYFQAVDLQGLWIDPAWVAPCWRTNHEVDKALGLYAAAAARDWVTLAALGTMMVEDPAFSNAKTFLTYVAGNVELAYLALGDSNALVAFDNAHNNLLPQHTFERRWMQAAAAGSDDLQHQARR